MNTLVYMFSNEYLVCGEIIRIANYQAHRLLLHMLSINLVSQIFISYRDTHRE